MHEETALKILTSAFIAAAAFASCSALAQAPRAYPTKPVRIIVPFAAGGPTDYIARLVAEKLATALGQPFIVENRLGAGGVVGAEAALRSPPDGYTLLVASASYAVNPALMKMSFDAANDVQPVINMVVGSTVFAAHAGTPFNTLGEMVAYAKANPGKLNYATQGAGSITHVTTEAFLAATGITATHIPYKGIGPALTALASGEVQFVLPDYGAARALVTAGKVKILAVAGNRRLAELPNVPTAAEAGFPQTASSGSWQGMFAPKNTPPEVVDTLNREINRILRNKEVVEQLGARYAEPVGGTPDAFGAQVKADIARFGTVVRTVGIKAE
ncbi:MAG: tripartite tricarboxylate transporter substrate binding protein [Alcaligenaceae bacterium]|nr:tripartite tricarboxylate transporter substrate binding protein [Alcaligenaceae bacterium SAGV5]MPS54886.1 tripartite tricarboxylate transporter substrate binding protein [Alcaligenaceae bacterium SAGV3]MPT56465.1 tripartite tricarboxylate transporter substrate binding protein [Alcaligenaceae bacterium]